MILETLAAIVLQQSCIRDGDRVRGELRFVETRHPNGTLMRSPFVVIRDPVCVEDDFGRAEGRWIQLAPEDHASFEQIPAGSGIVVVASYATPMTAWHFGDIVAHSARVVGYELQ